MAQVKIQVDLKQVGIVNVENGIVNIGQSWQRHVRKKDHVEMGERRYERTVEKRPQGREKP